MDLCMWYFHKSITIFMIRDRALPTDTEIRVNLGLDEPDCFFPEGGSSVTEPEQMLMVSGHRCRHRGQFTQISFLSIMLKSPL